MAGKSRFAPVELSSTPVVNREVYYDKPVPHAPTPKRQQITYTTAWQDDEEQNWVELREIVRGPLKVGGPFVDTATSVKYVEMEELPDTIAALTAIWNTHGKK